MPTANQAPGRATLHRMVLPEHTCPFGLKALRLLEENGFEVDDRQLTTREATDAFKEEHGVATTPLVFVGGERIGDSADLAAWLSSRGVAAGDGAARQPSTPTP